MYNISAQPAKAFNEPNKPFGGLNMIFSGDFPSCLLLVVESLFSLYSGSIGTQIYSGLKSLWPESAIGKALWHQVTTVVILRENMRQKSQSPEDANFTKLLKICGIKAVLRKTLNFYALASQGLEQVDPSY